MVSGINSGAGTQSIQASMVRNATQAPTGSAPSAPITTPRSAAQANVSQLFAVTAELSSQLKGLLDGAEARRVQGQEGIDMNSAAAPIQEMQQQLEELKARGATVGRFAEELSAQVDQVVKGGAGSVNRIAEVVAQTQQRMA